MDPLSALSIAAAVVQFADFGFRLVKSAHELYKSPSGQKSEYVELSIVSHDLSHLADAVGAKLGDNEGPAGEVFFRLSRECASTNDELQEMLGKLKARGSTKIALAADSWRVTLRQVATAGDIERLANRLSQIRQQMNVALLYLLLDEAWKHGVELRQFAKQQTDMIATLDRIDSTTKQFSTDIIGLIDKWPVNNQLETNEMVRYVLSDKWKASEYAKRTLLDENQDGDKLDKMCQGLYFESISHREASIPKRHAATFEWIFHGPRTSEDGHPLWSGFPQWLRGDSPDIYWITGKPGAGKSTLVKFIAQDPRFEALLRRWAAGSQLLVARFFSWTSGANRLQKSHEGLFRTLLLEAIQQRAQLVVDIFPARWFLLQSFNGNVNLPALTMDELRAGFQNLLSATGEKVKLALLIDGLDEFDEDHRQLVQLLHDTNGAVGVKICASSRPWNIFKDAYSKNPMLQLENLTREDIKSFVQEQLELSPGYHDFAATSPLAARKIITDIVDKSQGVFLWVSVISGLLEAGFQEGTGISDLQAAVDKLPSEVADLFRYIWNRTGKRFRAEASRFFQVMKACQEQKTDLYALALWFGDKEIPVDLNAAEVTSTYLTGIIKSLERKLMSRTGGLLELVSIHDDHTKEPERVRVDFMHRTANDWVCDNWASITSATDPDFDPCFWIVKGEALSVVLTTAPNPDNVRGLIDWPGMFDIASLIPDDHPDRRTLVIALGRLDNHIDSHMAKFPGSSDIYWASQLNLVSTRHGKYALPDLPHKIGLEMLSCTDLLELAARVLISPYLKQRAREDPDLFPTSGRYQGTVNNVIFGEIWFYNPVARLDVLDFLTQEKYRPWLDGLNMAKAKAEYAKLIVCGTYSTHHPIIAYFTQVIRMLEFRIPRAGSQDGQSGAGVDGSINPSKAIVASDLQDPKPRSKWRREFRVSFGKIFGRKQS
ncbi:hypothetical protein B0T25DRAFT_225232 [Lasiosphaeria hispida]|uniref:NACHT domain-containing protein n=1 Tax=Lasiosphaeria hispida TaxID=260671 RepID=A0AAJ0MF14_9PEZI|nr:hypothetical protein B0T25DRAFT_225232 [Lasiosphaeria hispida]